MKKLKPEYQPGGSKRHEILDKAVEYILKDPKFGTQGHKHMHFCWKDQVGLSESEYLTCLNNSSWRRLLAMSRRPGAPMAQVYLGHWRWLEATRTKLQATSRKLQASSRKLDKGPVLCYRSIHRRKKYESK